MVTIPTTLALEETKRLLQQLEEQDIRCGLATWPGGIGLSTEGRVRQRGRNEANRVRMCLNMERQDS